MTKTDLEFFLKDNIALDLETFLINLIVSALLSFLVQIFYIKFSSTLSNKFEFSKNFVVLGIATTIIITIVKSSLALSLGLVGALSIVRFRAAIKEPEELVYLFIIIAIGLGCGAGQVKIVFSGVIFTLLIIAFYSFFYKKTKKQISEILNIAISRNGTVNEKEIDAITKEIKKYASNVDFVSITKSKDNTTINFDIIISSFEKINYLINKIEKRKFKVIVARNDINSI
tara:strand:+ start:1670 stop:2356 length:687 start_codon:yes stop_codon:yes gene_type:complete